jgi:ribonuclease HII
MLRTVSLAIIAFLIISPALVVSSEGADKDDSLKLSKKHRRVLAAEMKILQRHMNRLAVAVPEGDWEQISATSIKMCERNIINKRLTDDERHEFNNSLPGDYLRIEQEFYKAAEMLAEAAENSNPQFVSLFYSKLNEHCIACHSRYAKRRFPGFRKLQ